MEVPVAPLFKQHTIRVQVTGLGRARVRLWLCVQLLKLASAIGGVHLDVRT